MLTFFAASFQIEETPSPISDVARRKQADLESRTYEYNVLTEVTTPAPESKYEETDKEHIATAVAGSGLPNETPTPTNDSQQLEQDS